MLYNGYTGKVKLFLGETYCEDCDGTGYHRNQQWKYCETCFGKGKLDWIERIILQKPNIQ